MRTLAHIKRMAKAALGERPAEILSRGMNTLQHYPPYILGDGFARNPRRVTFEITYRCNARCRMCPLYGEHLDGKTPAASKTREKELGTEQITGLLEQAKALGVETVTFTGGEALIRKDLTSLVAHASQLNMKTHIITNGSLLTADMANGLVRAGLRTMDLSIDGPAAVHDNIRRVPGLFDKAVGGLESLDECRRKAGVDTPHVTLACTVSALNQDSLAPVVEVAAKFGASVDFSPIFYRTNEQLLQTEKMTGGENIKPEDQRISTNLRQVQPDILMEEINKAHSLARQKSVSFSCRLDSQRDIEKRFFDPQYSEQNKCLIPWYALRIDPFGHVYPCSISSLMGNVTTQSLEDIWNGDAYRRFRKKLRREGLFPSCSKCCVLNKRDIILKVLPRLSRSLVLPSAN